MPSPALKALCMDYIVEVERGRFFGPFHKDVVASLRKSGALPEGAAVYARAGAD